MKVFSLLSAILFLNVCGAQNVTTINKGKVVQKNYNVSVPYKDIRGLLIVQAVIKDKAYNFLVDTGAMSAISQQMYYELGLQSNSGLDVGDSSNLVQNMKLATLPPVQVGGITFKDVPAVVAGNNFLFQCLGIDGCIGSNMLRNSVVKFSHKDKTISFTDKLKNFSTDKKKSAGLLEDKMQSNPYLWVSLKNNGAEGSETLMFDSGMVGMYDLSLTAYESTFRQANIFSVLHQASGAYSVGIHGVENPTEHFMLVVPELNFAGVTLKNVTTTTTSDTKSRIGSQILSYGDIVIDYPKRQLYFNPYSDGDIDLTEKNWPVQPVMSGDKFVVGIVWDPAYGGRVNKGDEVMKFGETDYSGMDPCESFKLDMKPRGDSATMVLKDINTGEIKNVELIKK
ncbi:retropepsin-like aspartic protease [uncultured Flavobacterium sp.]|uniref:retropepsin-like aspartic protease n=1 Tax=uncultured Flavobacterium sp. TaxID=165435 RepID=UPI0025DD5322|nr:retropepsin-like aspartic protease [uncultured Flavobacterium sp.]